jgi:tetratricopeptide (TPR) repeat protein
MNAAYQKPSSFSHTRMALLLALFLALPLFLGLPFASGAELSEARIADLFHQANDLFHQADQTAAKNPEKAKTLYLQAAMRYEKIVKQGGVHNGRLYYDIANAYFRTKDIGRAILNYRRAQQYIPDDENLRQNLAYARNKRLDKIGEQQEIKVFKTLFFWHYDLSTPDKILLFSIFFISIWVLAGLYRFVRRPALGWMVAVVVVLSMMMGGSLVAESISLYQIKPGVITEASVPARKGNSTAYAPSFKEPLHAGTEFNLIENRDNWLYIKLFDGRTCWIPSKTAEMVR